MLEDPYKEIIKQRCEKTGKVCYSLRDAREAIRLAKRRTNGCKNKIPLRTYFCKYCGTYHNTSQKTQMSKRGKWNG